MFQLDELRQVSFFDCLDDAQLRRLATTSADVRLCADEFLIREGESPSFFVVIEGALDLIKDFGGKERHVFVYRKGDFFGEVPLLLTSSSVASVRAKETSRVVKLDLQQFKELIDTSPECSALIMKTMSARVSKIQDFVREAPGTRVLVVGSQYDTDCRDIRSFLSMNRIPYEWVDREREPERVPVCMPPNMQGPAVVIDHERCVGQPPTVRKVAEALDMQTQPNGDDYDVAVIGGGPAGLAAAVYGSSEGLRVLLVERSAAGGQAGTSTRIENYLGFPGGISGDDLSQRALKQASRFGAEVVMSREVHHVYGLGDGRGYCIELDGGDRVSTRTAILATGVDWRRLQADGIDRLLGRGVLYGASRTEASTVVGKHVFIVGGGNSAGQAAMFFSSYARSVRVLVRGAGLNLSMSQYLIDQFRTRPNIEVEPFTQVVSVNGDDHLESICTVTQGQSARSRPADALFVMIGADAHTTWLPRELQRDAKGYICTGRDVSDIPGWAGNRVPFLLETNLPGLFCAGDVRHDSIKRVSSGVGEGSMAIAFVHQYLALQGAPAGAQPV